MPIAILSFLLPLITEYLRTHPEIQGEMIAFVKSVVAAISGSSTTSAQAKADLDVASAALENAATRLLGVGFPGDQA